MFSNTSKNQKSQKEKTPNFISVVRGLIYNSSGIIGFSRDYRACLNPTNLLLMTVDNMLHLCSHCYYNYYKYSKSFLKTNNLYVLNIEIDNTSLCFTIKWFHRMYNIVRPNHEHTFFRSNEIRHTSDVKRKNTTVRMVFYWVTV